MHEPKIEERAAALGILPPIYTEAVNPGLWAAWRDRVLQAESDAERGRDPATMIREAAIYGGHKVEPAHPPALVQQAAARSKAQGPADPTIIDQLREKMEALIKGDQA